MTFTEPIASPLHQPEAPDQPFCAYLAKQFIAKKGFQIASVPEARQLAVPGDILLTYADGHTFTILCMIDRETYPDASFDLDVDRVRQIGEACLRYTGRVNGAKMPVFIRIMEIGPGSAGQQGRLKLLKRSSLRAKVVPSAMIVDTVSGEVWNSDKTWIARGGYHHFVQKLLTAPREDDANLTPPLVVVAQPSFPVLTVGILAALCAVFAAEMAYGIGPPPKPLQPAIATLVAFGGLMRSLVVQSGQWYRLFSAPFLHLDVGHLAMNGFALLLAGWRLESLVGRAWFGAIYVVSALCGSLLSLALNPPFIVAVGASGAIMGLFAAMLVASAHLPPGAPRVALQKQAIYVLIPSLLPLAGAARGHAVDYAAHFGGAFGGVAVGLVMLKVWLRSEPLPEFRQAAAAIAVAGVAVLAYPMASVARQYDTAAFAANLIPRESYPSEAVGISQSSYYVKRYPRDPRSHLFRALALFTSQDLAGAENEAREGLREEDRWNAILPGDVSLGLRTTLAMVIASDRLEEAKAVVRPVCHSSTGGRMRKILDDSKLCSS